MPSRFFKAEREIETRAPWAGAALLGKELAARVGVLGTVLGFPEPPLHESWDQELKAARPALLTLAEGYEKLLTARQVPLTVMGRCASALATLPGIARHWPEACVVWFDAHADSNTPTSVAIPYLGGMVISGAAGMWATGLADGLRLSNVVLVGLPNGADSLQSSGYRNPKR